MTVVAHGRPVRLTRARYSRAGSAAAMLAETGFGRGMDVVLLTDGQWSFIDLLSALLDITGPADVAVSTWSAGFYDVAAAERFRDSGRLTRIRFVMDSSRKRGQASVVSVGDIFGDDAVRATRNHAKFATIEAPGWSILVVTSANLNLNERNEWFSVADEPERCAMLRRFVDDLWATLPAGDTGDRRTPRAQRTAEEFGLRSLSGIATTGTVAGTGAIR